MIQVSGDLNLSWMVTSVDRGLLRSFEGYRTKTVRLLYNHLPTRILEEDRIEFVAVVQGPYTYQTANRGSITIPLLRVVEVRVLE